jgi:hypothetical protein
VRFARRVAIAANARPTIHKPFDPLPPFDGTEQPPPDEITRSAAIGVTGVVGAARH